MHSSAPLTWAYDKLNTADKSNLMTAQEHNRPTKMSNNVKPNRNPV